MLIIEMCIHQFLNPVWESCKTCAYDPENNKKCSAYFHVSTIERCVHQIFDEGVHLLFKEQWEKCKECAYDPENNKKCPNYSPISYCVSDNNSNLVSSIPPNFDGVRA